MPKVKLESENLDEIELPVPTAAETVVVELPIGQAVNGYFPLHIDIRINSDAAQALRRIAGAYSRAGAKLKNGRRVESSSQAVLKIIEEIAEAFPK